MEPLTPSFKVHGERCPQEDFTTHPPPTMLCPPPADVGESMYPRRRAVARREPGDYSSPTPPLFSKQAENQGAAGTAPFCMGEVIAMGKHKALKHLARGHGWAAGRPTQTHGDKRQKRLKTRSARLRQALKEAW